MGGGGGGERLDWVRRGVRDPTLQVRIFDLMVE